MEEAQREELRRLALWLSRRRQVDEAVEHLTAYGPAASQRVNSHLDALRALLAAEQDAFRAIEAAAPAVVQAPLPATYEAPETDGATVHSLADHRRLS